MLTTYVRRMAVPLGLTILAVLLFAACGDDDDGAPTIILDNTPEGETERELGASFVGGRVNPPYPMPEGEVVADSGEPFDIAAETDGYVTLFYVGYTHCPDICPTHMATVAAALADLPQETRDRVRVLFATADPERDTPEVLDAYLAQFDPSFIGLTGTREQMDALQQSIGLNTAEQTPLDDNGNYSVNHTAYIIAYGAEDGLGHLIFLAGMSKDDVANDIFKLARDGYDA